MPIMNRLAKGFGFDALRVAGEAFATGLSLSREAAFGSKELGGAVGIAVPSLARKYMMTGGRALGSWAMAKEYSGSKRLQAIGMRGALAYGTYGAVTGAMYGGSNTGTGAGAVVGAGAGYMYGGPVGARAGAAIGAGAGRLLTGGLGPAVYGAMAPLRTTTDLFSSAVGSVTGFGTGMYSLLSNSAINPLAIIIGITGILLSFMGINLT